MLVAIERAKAARRCHQCGQKILRGAAFLHLVKGAAKYAVSVNICSPCLRCLALQTVDQEIKDRFGIQPIPQPGFEFDGTMSF